MSLRAIKASPSAFRKCRFEALGPHACLPSVDKPSVGRFQYPVPKADPSQAFLAKASTCRENGDLSASLPKAGLRAT
jgi:hypothetical protein